ncbi:MAG TPA: hypothetical protein VME92_10730 [Acetobacteraceae bacterium]|nr:hypothetical protein [Acetobacteraceae bacterium]
MRVLVPQAAARLLTLPLEIACLGDAEPLSRAGVSFVFETIGQSPPAAEPVGQRLRLLALFSLPPAGSPLNLRRERQMLRGLVRRLVGAHGLAVKLQVLQYGVTRDRLREVLEQGEGWDVIHFSGHGLPGSLVLEQPDGRPDLVPATELAGLLREAGGRVKLVMLSACLSAAASIDQTLTLLDLTPEAAPRRKGETGADAAEPAKAAPTVARALTEALDCAVLAMRYAVEDEFAIAFGAALYDRLLRQKQTLPQAIRLALGSATGGGAAAAVGALSAAAPALFGPRAADLVLLAPQGAGIDLDTTLAEVPREANHFVGRVTAMTQASAALAAESERSGVLFHGMAGAGKTSCAVELVHHHANAGGFQRFVWYAAPEQGKDTAGALRDFALAMERQLGLPMVHVIDRDDSFRTWLPRLVEVLENNAVLIGLDNLESLLTEAGQWRDERWRLLLEALLTPGGLSRTLLTSRIRPAGLAASALVIPVHALPRDEALLLVRELPNLRRLLDGKAAGMGLAEQRALVRRTLRLVQGHPKLLEFAEALASDPAKLAAQLDRADAVSDQMTGKLEAFFQEAETQLDPAALLASLRGWTDRIAGALPEAARLFFQFLCALEEGDREGWVIRVNWSDVWQRLGRPAPAPEFAPLLAQLVSAGLVDRQATGEGEDDFTVGIHPGVAEAGRGASGPDLQPAVDQELAATWRQNMQWAWKAHGQQRTGAAIVRAGLSGFPYLARLGAWNDAAVLLDHTVTLDASPATVAAVLPLARRLAEGASGTGRETQYSGLLAGVLLAAGRLDEAEAMLRETIALAAGHGDFSTASVVSGDLANLLREWGRPDQALQVVEQKAEYTRQAGHGPWSQLLDEGMRLQVLNQLGQHRLVLDRVTTLRAQMCDLPNPPGENDWASNAWNVRETLLDVGSGAALRLGEWEQALELNAAALRSEMDRGASQLQLARGWFNDYGPLLGLGRHDDARALLQRCRAVFEQVNAVSELGAIFSALGDLESGLGHHDTARRFEETALRYRYVAGTPQEVRTSHFNLANYLIRTGADWRNVLTHRLAAILIAAATQSGMLRQDVAALAGDFRQAGRQAEAALPVDFAGLCATVQEVEGVRFQELMQRLLSNGVNPNELLHAMIAKAMEMNSRE